MYPVTIWCHILASWTGQIDCTSWWGREGLMALIIPTQQRRPSSQPDWPCPPNSSVSCVCRAAAWLASVCPMPVPLRFHLKGKEPFPYRPCCYGSVCIIKYQSTQMMPLVASIQWLSSSMLWRLEGKRRCALFSGDGRTAASLSESAAHSSAITLIRSGKSLAIWPALGRPNS